MSEPRAVAGVSELRAVAGPSGIGAARTDALGAAAALARGETPPPARVAREFEALLLSQLARQLSQPLPGTRPLDGGSAGRMYREQFFQQVTRLAAERGGFGLAEALERQLGGAAPPEPAGEDPS